MQIILCIGDKRFKIAYSVLRLALNLNVPTNEYSSVLDVLGYLREYTYLSDNILPLIQQF